MDAHGADGLPSRRSFQSGLSWRTILAKRENFRAAFAEFDFRELRTLTTTTLSAYLPMKELFAIEARSKP